MNDLYFYVSCIVAGLVVAQVRYAHLVRKNGKRKAKLFYGRADQ